MGWIRGALVGLSALVSCIATVPASAGVGVDNGVPVQHPSSSAAVPKAQAHASVLDAPDPDAITFDELPLGTEIDDEYSDRGVVFSSDVFLSIDNSNPTAPVLSGTPRFFGDISGKFTTPGTTTPTTVNGFTLDVGFIDNRNSVEIQYFDAAGDLIGSTRAQSFAINRIDVFYRGVASFTVKAVEYEAAGFAIDNLVVHDDAVGSRPIRMVEFGDSYSSGEGLIGYDGLRYDCGTDLHEGKYFEGTTQRWSLFWSGCQTATGSTRKPRGLLGRKLVKYENLCHRHGRAYPNQIRERLGISSANAIFVACSGAETKHVGAGVGPEARFPDSPPGVHGGKSQFDTVKDFAGNGGPPDLITIGIGGNDAGFADIIEECIVHDCTDLDFRIRAISTINGSMFRNVRTTLETLRSEFSPATIVSFGYPSVIDDPATWCAGMTSISDDERAWLKGSVLPTVNEAIEEAADDAGVVYVDITSVTAGHGVCSEEPWINGARLGDDSWWRKGNESFHPNERAHDAITTYFIDHYTDGSGQLIVKNPEPAAPIRPETGGEIRLGEIDLGAVRKCGAGCLQPTACVQSCKVHVEGDGFAPGVTMTAVLQSDPVTLGEVGTDESGHIGTWLRLPRKLGGGTHSLTLDGMAADGTRQHAVQRFEVFGRLGTRIKARLGAGKRAGRVRVLKLKRLPARARIDIACAKGAKRVARALAGGRVKRHGGCPFSHRILRTGKAGKGKAGKRGARTSRKRKRRRGAGRSLARYFKAPLSPGTTVRVVVTRRGRAGRTLDIRVRGRGAAKLRRGCTEPGLRIPTRC